MDEDWAAEAIKAVTSAVTPMAMVNIRPMRGAIADPAPDVTAFAHRRRVTMAVAAGLPRPNAVA